MTFVLIDLRLNWITFDVLKNYHHPHHFLPSVMKNRIKLVRGYGGLGFMWSVGPGHSLGSLTCLHPPPRYDDGVYIQSWQCLMSRGNDCAWNLMSWWGGNRVLMLPLFSRGNTTISLLPLNSRIEFEDLKNIWSTFPRDILNNPSYQKYFEFQR